MKRFDLPFRPFAAALIAASLLACSPLPDTVGEAAPTGTLWRLVSINDAPAGFSATLRFQPNGRVTGAGPCNGFTAQQTAPLPWVEIVDFVATRRGCDAQISENAFFLALQQMAFAEAAGDSLLLTNDAGQSLFFRSGTRDPSAPRDGP